MSPASTQTTKKITAKRVIYGIGTFVTLYTAVAIITGKASIPDWWKKSDEKKYSTHDTITYQIPDINRIKEQENRSQNQNKEKVSAKPIPEQDLEEIQEKSPEEKATYYYEQFKLEVGDSNSNYNRQFTYIPYQYRGTNIKRLYDSSTNLIKEGYTKGQGQYTSQHRYLTAVITVGNLDLTTRKDTNKAKRLYDGIYKITVKDDPENQHWDNNTYRERRDILHRLADILIFQKKFTEALGVIACIDAADNWDRYSEIFYGAKRTLLGISKVRGLKENDQVSLKLNSLSTYLLSADSQELTELMDNIGIFLNSHPSLVIECRASLMDLRADRLRLAKHVQETIMYRLLNHHNIDKNRIIFDDDPGLSGTKFSYLKVSLVKPKVIE